MTGQGQFVILRDFNGDGQVDFIVSEGNFPCAGRPQLFRPNGLARLQLYLGGGAEGASLAFEDRLLAYRVLDGRPARLQIARRAPACGTASRCGDELRWNAAAGRFDEVATDGRGVPNRPATGAVASVAMAAPTAVAQTIATGPAAAALRVQPGAEAAFKAQCRRENQARYPNMSAQNLAGQCVDGWAKAVAAGPIADALLAAVPVQAGQAVTLADLRARLESSASILYYKSP
jgi:hypothetical protein